MVFSGFVTLGVCVDFLVLLGTGVFGVGRGRTWADLLISGFATLGVLWTLCVYT